ncbi:hypothetical protein H7F51_05580 [Novosphingobium flavum]|uniref:Uncharacterized protein n=1 Tax=Novosphingobium flavum TaxID=1778672 RepID=A0A7X1KL54_9SPHN|nr:hypothetical protein [Novosphingobium flavum]MBC2664978.1 hypothetical protein [Novosphingobium flavum]
MRSKIFGLPLLMAAVHGACVTAQPISPAALAESAAPVPAPTPVPSGPAIPALTPLVLRFEAEMSSQTSKTGEHFPISLAEPVLLDGKVVVPAGALGEGEVIHAKKSGGSGAAGELVLAARWLDVNGRHLRLRSLKAAVAGKDAIHQVDALNAASVMAPLPIGLLGFAISGAKAVYAKGSLATAKTAEAFAIEPTTISDGAPMVAAPENRGEMTDGN